MRLPLRLVWIYCLASSKLFHFSGECSAFVSMWSSCTCFCAMHTYMWLHMFSCHVHLLVFAHAFLSCLHLFVSMWSCPALICCVPCTHLHVCAHAFVPCTPVVSMWSCPAHAYVPFTCACTCFCATYTPVCVHVVLSCTCFCVRLVLCSHYRRCADVNDGGGWLQQGGWAHTGGVLFCLCCV